MVMRRFFFTVQRIFLLKPSYCVNFKIWKLVLNAVCSCYSCVRQKLVKRLTDYGHFHLEVVMYIIISIICQ